MVPVTNKLNKLLNSSKTKNNLILVCIVALIKHEFVGGIELVLKKVEPESQGC